MLRFFKKKPLKKGFTLLGTKGVCEDCGAEGVWCLDPYAEELRGEKIPTCLCRWCYGHRCEDI